MSAPPRVVLDTNVCLDLFVFADPRCRALREALASGAVEAVTCAECEDEWLAVLHYPELALDEKARSRAMAAFARAVKRLPASTSPPTRLPRCTDPDDQKFVELAARAGADWLVSRDRALLALHRRGLRQGGFAVVSPQDWPAPFGRPVAPGYVSSAKPV